MDGGQTYFSESVGLLGRTLGLAGWVTEGEDDWLLVKVGHVFDDSLCEGSWDGSDTWM